MTKFPEVKVALVGHDGNAFAILARCRQAIRQAGLPGEVFKDFQKEATSGDYNHLLATVIEWFDVDSDGYDPEQYWMDEDEFGEE